LFIVNSHAELEREPPKPCPRDTFYVVSTAAAFAEKPPVINSFLES
jgi:hypothetical protein